MLFKAQTQISINIFRSLYTRTCRPNKSIRAYIAVSAYCSLYTHF